MDSATLKHAKKKSFFPDFLQSRFIYMLLISQVQQVFVHLRRQNAKGKTWSSAPGVHTNLLVLSKTVKSYKLSPLSLFFCAFSGQLLSINEDFVIPNVFHRNSAGRGFMPISLSCLLQSQTTLAPKQSSAMIWAMLQKCVPNVSHSLLISLQVRIKPSTDIEQKGCQKPSTDLSSCKMAAQNGGAASAPSFNLKPRYWNLDTLSKCGIYF